MEPHDVEVVLVANVERKRGARRRRRHEAIETVVEFLLPDVCRIGVPSRLVFGYLKTLAHDGLDPDGWRQQVRAAAAEEVHLSVVLPGPADELRKRELVRL